MLIRTMSTFFVVLTSFLACLSFQEKKPAIILSNPNKLNLFASFRLRSSRNHRLFYSTEKVVNGGKWRASEKRKCVRSCLAILFPFQRFRYITTSIPGTVQAGCWNSTKNLTNAILLFVNKSENFSLHDIKVKHTLFIKLSAQNSRASRSMDFKCCWNVNCASQCSHALLRSLTNYTVVGETARCNIHCQHRNFSSLIANCEYSRVS